MSTLQNQNFSLNEELCMNIQFFHKIIYDLKCNFYVIVIEKFYDFFTLRTYDLITTLTYVLMDNFLVASQGFSNVFVEVHVF